MASNRNFNSLQEYMSYYWKVFGAYVFGIGLVIFIALNLLIFGGLSLYGMLCNRHTIKQKKVPEHNDISADTKLDKDAVDDQIHVSDVKANSEKNHIGLIEVVNPVDETSSVESAS